MKRALWTTMAILLLGFGATGHAAEFKSGAITVSDIWARASAGPAMKNGAAFAVLSTDGAEMDRLVGAESPAADRVELHTHMMDGGVMRMRQVEAIEVHPGTPTVLQPGGLHVMFLGLRAPLKEGDKVPLTLVFEKAGRIAVSADVLAPGAMGKGAPAPQGHGMGHKPAG